MELTGENMVKANIVNTEQQPANFGWLQFEKKATRELQHLAMASPPAMGTLMYIVSNMNGTNALMASQQAIASGLGCTRETVNIAIKELQKRQFIQVIKSGGANIYVVNSRVAWQGKRGARFTTFRADIIAIESEQKTDIDSKEPLKGVPIFHPGERLLVGNENLDPPDQQEMELP